MKVSELREILSSKISEGFIDKTIQSIAHWLLKIKKETDGEYPLKEGEEKSLQNIEKLGLIKIQENKAKMTEEGEDLYQEFDLNGFYGSDTVKRFFEKVKDMED